LLGLAKQWSKTADDISKRQPVWHQLTSLLEHAKDLGPYAGLKAEADAIIAQRSLLAEPDHVRPLLDRTADLLRQALNAKLQAIPQPLRSSRVNSRPMRTGTSSPTPNEPS